MNKKNTIAGIVQSGLFNEIDIHFAKFIIRLTGSKDSDLFLASALVSHVTGKGDVCLKLDEANEQLDSAFPDSPNPFRLPAPNKWEEALISSQVVGRPETISPLILDKKGRLYLSRYFEYENSLSEKIKEIAHEKIMEFDCDRLTDGLNRLFPAEPDGQADLQKIAAVVAILNRFCIISGGPGTGKTYTVSKILALLLEQSPLCIALTAPTGKAAARLSESIATAKHTLNTSDTVLSQFPQEAITIHRLLKPIFETPYFHYNAENLLPYDVILVDEASMVDLALMYKLMQAIPPEARLILIGDKDQLASVEAGSVLGDFCDRDRIHANSESFRDSLMQIIGEPFESESTGDKTKKYLSDNIIILKKSHRFDISSGVGGFSKAVNSGDVESALNLLKNKSDASLKWRPVTTTEQLYRIVNDLSLSGYSDFLKSRDPMEAVQRFNGTQLLCALNKGPYGVIEINRSVERVLLKAGRIFYDNRHMEPWYDKRPVMITRNNYELGLYNGDIGIALSRHESEGEAIFIYFPGQGFPTNDDLKVFTPDRLPEHETVFAMTVHKSQGSEFDHVVLVLPDKKSPVLTRELIYTAVTRARKRVSILGSEAVLRWALSRKIHRTSGLRDALWE